MEKQTFSSQRGEQISNLKPFPGGYCSTLQISVSELSPDPPPMPKDTYQSDACLRPVSMVEQFPNILMNKINRNAYILGTIRNGIEAHLVSSAKIISISHLHRQNFMSHAPCNSDPRVQIVGD